MTDHQALAFLSFLCGLVIVGIVNVNIWYHKERARMTPDERKAEDEEDRRVNPPW